MKPVMHEGHNISDPTACVPCLQKELTVARKCVDELRVATDHCQHGGDNDSCRWCELVAEFDELYN